MCLAIHAFSSPRHDAFEMMFVLHGIIPSLNKHTADSHFPKNHDYDPSGGNDDYGSCSYYDCHRMSDDFHDDAGTYRSIKLRLILGCPRIAASCNPSLIDTIGDAEPLYIRTVVLKSSHVCGCHLSHL